MKIEILKKATKQTPFHKFLLENEACTSGYRFARKFEDPQEFWEKCPHVGWLVWLSSEVHYQSEHMPSLRNIMMGTDADLYHVYCKNSYSCLRHSDIDPGVLEWSCIGFNSTPVSVTCKTCLAKSAELVDKFRAYMPENPWITWQRSLDTRPGTEKTCEDVGCTSCE